MLGCQASDNTHISIRINIKKKKKTIKYWAKKLLKLEKRLVGEFSHYLLG